MDWLVQAVIGLVLTGIIGAISFFLKRTLSQIEKRQDSSEAAFAKELEKAVKASAERHDRTEARVEKLETRLNKTLQEMPTVYTLREDWLRTSSDINQKLDKITDILMSDRKGRTGE